MSWTLLSLEQEWEWTAALDGLPHACGHTWRYNRAMARSSGHPAFLFVHRGRTGTAALPFAERRHAGTVDIYSPYGWSGVAMSGADDSLPNTWRRFAQERGYVCGYLMMHPALPLPADFAPSNEVWRQNSAYLLNLTQPLDRMKAAMSTDHRQRLRQWERLGAELVDDQTELRQVFLELYPQFAQRIGASAVYHFTVDGLSILLESPHVLLLGARKNNEIRAVSLFLHNADVGEYFLTALREDGGPHTRALIWEAIKRLKARGVRMFNLGGGIRNGDALASFKQRFGGHAMEIVVIKQIYNPERFVDLCADSGVQPECAGYFPPYRAPAASTQQKMEVLK